MKDPNTNFQNVTRRTVDILHLIVLLLLPVIWLGDYKNLISLLFKTIRSSEPYTVEISRTVQILIIITGLLGYIIHRYYRRNEYTLRYETLKRGNSFVDVYDHKEVKRKLLNIITGLIEKQDAEWGEPTDWATDTEQAVKAAENKKSEGSEASDKKDTKPKRRRWNAQGIFRKSHSDAENSIKRRREVL